MYLGVCVFVHGVNIMRDDPGQITKFYKTNSGIQTFSVSGESLKISKHKSDMRRSVF